jgi:ribulose kinase
MVPGLWLNEGGQSATGALVDHVIFNHGATEILVKAMNEAGYRIDTLVCCGGGTKNPVFHKLYEDQVAYRQLMAEPSS